MKEIVVGLTTSFVGSFLAFLVWIHFHLEERWQALRRKRVLRRYYSGRGESERRRSVLNEELVKRGLPLS